MRLRDSTGRLDSELQGTSGSAHMRLADAYDGSELVTKIAMLRWDTATLAWVKYTGTAAGGVASDVNVLNFPASQVVSVQGAYFATRIDEASSTVTYVGKAVVGTVDASALWQISRITVSGTVTLIEYAGGSSSFNAIWTNRAGLTYS